MTRGAKPAARRPTIPAVDLWLMAVITVVSCLLGPVPGFWPSPRLPVLISSVCLTVPLALRRVKPLLMLAIMTVAGVAQCAVAVGPTASLVAVPIAVYSVARWVDGTSSRLALLAGGLGSVIGPLRWVLSDRFVGQYVSRLQLFILLFIMCFAAVIVPYLIGRRTRENDLADQERAVAAIQRYEAELAAREQEARTTEARIRNDIARELHDVVAHSLSVIIVQAEGGRALAAKHPEAAAETLTTIAETGREALTEMRRIVGVLRVEPGQQGVDYTPSPGLADIAAMLDRAGERVRLVVRGRPPAVPATLGLTVYRVVQEAVTNFLKHAGPDAQCVVTLSYLPDQIRLEVVDDGLGSAATSDGAGHGLRGMQERVHSMGGRLRAHPGRAGGYEVQALLPLPPLPTQPSSGVQRSAAPQPDAGTQNQAGTQAQGLAARQPEPAQPGLPPRWPTGSATPGSDPVSSAE